MTFGVECLARTDTAVLHVSLSSPYALVQTCAQCIETHEKRANADESEVLNS